MCSWRNSSSIFSISRCLSCDFSVNDVKPKRAYPWRTYVRVKDEKSSVKMFSVESLLLMSSAALIFNASMPYYDIEDDKDKDSEGDEEQTV